MVLACFSPLAKHWLFGSALEGSDYQFVLNLFTCSMHHLQKKQKEQQFGRVNIRLLPAGFWQMERGHVERMGHRARGKGNTTQQPLATCLETKYFKPCYLVCICKTSYRQTLDSNRV
jgi:hypothetical protein